MSTKNKKSVASQALLEMDAITSAIKEESKKSINALLGEAVRNVLRENCEKEEKDDDEFEVIDDADATTNAEQESAKDKDESSEDTSDDTQDAVETPSDDNSVDADAEEDEVKTDLTDDSAEVDDAKEEAPEDGDEDSEWDEYSEYKNGDNEYNFTGEKDQDKIKKVYKLLRDDDSIVVVQRNNQIKVKDGENDAEYIIDLDDDAQIDSVEKVDDGEDMDIAPSEINESDIAGIDDDFSDETMNTDSMSRDSEIEELKDALNKIQARIDNLEIGNDAAMNENKKIKKGKKPMKENKDALFEVDLGYTDNYQHKDPIAGLSNNEPSKEKTLDKGVPMGTEKPWAGKTKGKGQPFDKPIEENDEPVLDGDMGDLEVDEQTNVGGFVQQNSVTQSRIPNSNGRKARNAHKDGAQVSSTSTNRSAMAEEIKTLKKENKELKEAILAIRKNLSEAYVTNSNLGKITKLFLENATSQAEKVDIVNRFTKEAKTIEQSKSLYESIKRELSKPKSTSNIMSETKTANGTKALNEAKGYESKDLLKTIDLMNRIMNY